MSIPCTNAPAKCEGEQPSEYPACVHEANAKPTQIALSPPCKHRGDNGTVAQATPEKRTGRKSMSRRSGQNGCIQEDGNWYVVRFWKDVAGQEKRQRVRERICPISGPGKLSASGRKHKAKEIIAASGADTAEHFEKVVRSNHGITFREQAEIWLEQMKNRKRKPVAPSTLENWERCLRNWLNPNIGDMPLDSVGNLALRNLGETMVKGGLGASAIRSYTNAVKMVVASAVNEEGDALYPRKWNHDFIDLPEDRNPKQPTLASSAVTAIVGAPKEKYYRMLYALCASAGLRFGEALGIDISNISPDCTTIKICQKAWRGQIHDYLKSESGKREVDLHPTVAEMLKDFIGERKSGLLFCNSKRADSSAQSNILRRSLHPILNQPRTAENWMSRISSFPYHLASQELGSRGTHHVLAWPRGKDGDRQLFQAEVRCGVSQASSRESGLGLRTPVRKSRCWTEWTETRSWTR